MHEPLEPGDPEEAGPYKLLARLGDGGMGSVYLGQSGGDPLVAVKIVHPHLARNERFLWRFRDEVGAARRVGGYYTTRVVDAGLDDRPPWVATAYIDGPSLNEMIVERGPLPVDEVKALGIGIAQGLAVVHAAGIVHRDLKPQNVLMDNGTPRLIDFGIARALDRTTYTGTRQPGTLPFMSPEQAAGETVDPRSDIFSLGSLLAHAATGGLPFRGESERQLIHRIVNEEPSLDGLDGELADVVRGCLAKDPDKRPTLGQISERLGGTPSPSAGSMPVVVHNSAGVRFELTTPRTRLGRAANHVLRLLLVPLGIGAILYLGQDLSLVVPTLLAQSGVDTSLESFAWHAVPLAAVLGALFWSTRHRYPVHDRLLVTEHGITLVDARRLRLRDASFFLGWGRLTRVRLVEEDDVAAVTADFRTPQGPIGLWGEDHAAFRSRHGYVLAWLQVRTTARARVVEDLRRALVRYGGSVVDPAS